MVFLEILLAILRPIFLALGVLVAVAAGISLGLMFVRE